MIKLEGLPVLGQGPFEVALYQEQEEEIWGDAAQVPLTLTVRLDNPPPKLHGMPDPASIALSLDIHDGLDPAPRAKRPAPLGQPVWRRRSPPFRYPTTLCAGRVSRLSMIPPALSIRSASSRSVINSRYPTFSSSANAR